VATSLQRMGMVPRSLEKRPVKVAEKICMTRVGQVLSVVSDENRIRLELTRGDNLRVAAHDGHPRFPTKMKGNLLDRSSLHKL
jgi:hypothetical protein